MNWLVIAFITPLAHAAVNHIDKYFISKYLRNGAVGSLVLFSALFALFALPFILLITPNVLAVPFWDATILAVNGAILVFAYIFYFRALFEDEASIVAPLFQLIPVFGFILGYAALGETLSRGQVAGSIAVIGGAILLSLSFSDSRVNIKRTVLLSMIAASFLYAVNGVLFKVAAVSTDQFWPSLFWDFMGKVLCGVLIFLTVKSYRQQFLSVLKENRASILALNSLNELLALIGEGALVFAVLLAPVALVQVVSGFQPLFVLLFGIILTIFFPHISKESLTKQDLGQKIAGILAIVVGTIIINRF